MMEIKNVAEFAAILDTTIAEVDRLVVSEPEYPPWAALQEQLHFMKHWSTSALSTNGEQPHAVNIGLIAAREMEPTDKEWARDLIDRLYLLNQFWRYWPTGQIALSEPPPKIARKVSVPALIAIAALPALLTLLRPLAQTQAGAPVSLGQPVAIDGKMAALTASLEPYTVSLNRNPERDRYQIQLRITDEAGHEPERLIPIAQGVRASELRFDARLLGNDGHQLWFYVKGIGAWNGGGEKLVTAGDLRRANPTLGPFTRKDNRNDPLIAESVRRIPQSAQELWDGEARLYQFDGRLQITTPDYRRVFTIEPATLAAKERTEKQ